MGNILPGLPGGQPIASREATGDQSISLIRESPPLSSDSRGIIITGNSIRSFNDKFEIDSIGFEFWIDSEYLKTILLFWDRIETFDIDTPGNIMPLEDIEFLENEGIITRTKVTSTGLWLTDERTDRARADLFKLLEGSEPGVWVIGSNGSKNSINEKELKKDRGIIVDLFGSIPVPSGEVPIEEILEFKMKRNSELLDLRYEIDSIYSKIISSPDIITSRSEIRNFDRKLADYMKSIRETSFEKILTNLTADLNIDFLRFSMVTGANLIAGLPLSTAIMTSGVATIGVSVGYGLKGTSTSKSPFQYVRSYHKNITWR